MFCTISTSSHLFKTFALAEGLQRFSVQLSVLLIDRNSSNKLETYPGNIVVYYLSELTSSRVEQAVKKYKGDRLRWALKPIFLLYLLQNQEKVIYVDNDISFLNSPQFLLKDLERDNVLLTPHFYPASPHQQQNWLEANFRIGLYNAGFIGTNRNAKEALEWWADCCLYELKKSYWRGLFDDQKYLDLFPILFEKVKIIKLRGCNLAGWNSNVELNSEQIIFIHFNQFTMNKFRKQSSFYRKYYDDYVALLQKQKSYKSINFSRWSSFEVKNALYWLKWKFSRKFF